MSREYLISPSYHASIEESGLKVDSQILQAKPDDDNNYYFCTGGHENRVDQFISFTSILWCDHIDDDIYDVSYAQSGSKKTHIRKASMHITSPITQFKRDDDNVGQIILDKSYPHSKPGANILILINPFSGQGKGKVIYDSEISPVLKAAKVNVTYQETRYIGHGTDIAKTLNVNDYDIIACCSGDGIPHEVINGFYQRSDHGVEAFNNIAITQLPCGSGNALSLSTHGTNDALAATTLMLKAGRTKIDLMAFKQQQQNSDDESIHLSFLSQCFGTIADADIGTEHLRWMGPIRFDLGILHKVVTSAKYPCDVYVDYKCENNSDVVRHFDHYSRNYDPHAPVNPITEDVLKLSGPKLSQPPPSNWVKIDSNVTDKLSIFYVGNMPYVSEDAQFFPAALPNDGAMDLIILDTNRSMFKNAMTLLGVSLGQHVNDNGIIHSKVLGYRLVPKLKNMSHHYLSIDGENYPVKPIQVQILPGVMTSLLTDFNYVDTCLKRSK